MKLNFKKITDNVMNRVPGLVVGAAGSKYIATGIDKMLGGKATPTITAGLTVLVGALLPGLLGSGTGKKDGFMNAMSDGIMTQGALKLGEALNLPGLHGTNTWDSISDAEDQMSGTDTADSISGNKD